jgi:hypothetical protein
MAHVNLPMTIDVLVFSFGLDCRASLLTLKASWVNVSNRGRFFGIVQIVENIDLLLAYSIAQDAFAASLSLPRVWIGILFWIISVRGHQSYQRKKTTKLMEILYLIAVFCASYISINT